MTFVIVSLCGSIYYDVGKKSEKNNSVSKHTMRPQQHINQPCTSRKHQRLWGKKQNTLHTLINTHAPCTYPVLCIYTQRNTPFAQTDSLTLTSIYRKTHTHTKTHNYISTLGVWQRRGKNQSGRPGTWMNRLWSKPHQRHIDDLPQTSIFLPSVGSGLLIASGVLVTSATLACSGSQNQLVTIKCWLDLLSRLVTQ